MNYLIENTERDCKIFALGKDKEVVIGSARDRGVVGRIQPDAKLTKSEFELLKKLKYFGFCVDTSKVRVIEVA